MITLWDDQALVGIAPLMIARRAGLRRLEFTGTPAADYQDFILGRRTSELLPLLGRHLFERRDAWDMIVLRNVPTDSPTFAILPAAMRSLGLGATDFERVSCPTLHISSRPAEVDRLLRSYSMRRRLKLLRQEGEITFTRCETASQIEHYLPLFFEQYLERRKGSAAARSFDRPEMRAFYAALAKSLLLRGWLHFSVLECGARPVAFHFGFEFDGRLYWYKPCFDPTMARQSPGTVLLSFLIRDAHREEPDRTRLYGGGRAFQVPLHNCRAHQRQPAILQASLASCPARWVSVGCDARPAAGIARFETLTNVRGGLKGPCRAFELAAGSVIVRHDLLLRTRWINQRFPKSLRYSGCRGTSLLRSPAGPCTFTYDTQYIPPRLHIFVIELCEAKTFENPHAGIDIASAEFLPPGGNRRAAACKRAFIATHPAWP